MGQWDLRSKEYTHNQQNNWEGGKSKERKDGKRKQDEIFPYSIQLAVECLQKVISELTSFLHYSEDISYTAHLTYTLIEFGILGCYTYSVNYAQIQKSSCDMRENPAQTGLSKNNMKFKNQIKIKQKQNKIK